MPKDRFVRIKTVVEMIGMSRSSVWRLSQEDDSFPKPIRIGKRMTVWSSNELLSWMERKKTLTAPSGGPGGGH
jgi:prophage regulatory protein